MLQETLSGSGAEVGPALDDGEQGKCAEYLLDIVDANRGILGVEFDTQAARLSVHYDAAVVPAQQVDELAETLGEQLGRHYGLCRSKDNGGGCEACSLTLDQGIRRRGDSLARLMVAPQTMSLAAGGQVAASPAEITRPVTRAPAAGQKRALAAWLERYREAGLVVLTALLIVAGWAGGWLAGLSPQLQTILFALAYLTGGYAGAVAGVRDLRRRVVNVDLLMVLAALGAATIGNWREGAILLFLFSLSNTLQSYAMGRSRAAIHALMQLRPDEALVRRGDREVLIRVERLRTGDCVIVRPGERIAADGVVVEGESAIDQSTITGESIPVDVAPGAHVFAGTLNTRGALELSVTRLAAESTLARIIELVENAQEEKARTQRFLDKFEQKYALGVIAATLLAIVLPLLLGRPFGPTFYRAMTLLVVASPCALVISTPASILSAIANAARRGILFKGGIHLENMSAVRAIAFDKTGTLTRGKPALTDIVPFDGYSEEQLLRLAANLEARSEHPLALAIVSAARQRGFPIEPAQELQALTGRGARAVLGGRAFLIGNRELFAVLRCDGGCPLPSHVQERVDTMEAAGKTVMLVGDEDGEELFGALAVADEVRPESKVALQKLRELGVEHIVMLTGDNERVASAIAAQTGADAYYAGLLPEDKVRVVQELAQRYGAVAMVGDGVNDAPALATANIGIAMGAAGSDVALETADIVLMSDDLTRVPYIKALSRKAQRVMWQNIGFSLAVIAVLVISNFLVGVPLPLGVVGHEGSTLVVVANGLRLLRGLRV